MGKNSGTMPDTYLAKLEPKVAYLALRGRTYGKLRILPHHALAHLQSHNGPGVHVAYLRIIFRYGGRYEMHVLGTPSRRRLASSYPPPLAAPSFSASEVDVEVR